MASWRTDSITQTIWLKLDGQPEMDTFVPHPMPSVAVLIASWDNVWSNFLEKIGYTRPTPGNERHDRFYFPMILYILGVKNSVAQADYIKGLKAAYKLDQFFEWDLTGMWTQSIPVATAQPILPVETIQPVVVAEEQVTQAQAIAPYVPEIQEQMQTLAPVAENIQTSDGVDNAAPQVPWVWIVGLIAAFNILG